MNIKRLLGLQSDKEKIEEYKSLLNRSDKISARIEQLAVEFSEKSSIAKSLSSGLTEDEKVGVIDRFNIFMGDHVKQIESVKKEKASIEKSMKNLESDQNISDSLEDLKYLHNVKNMRKVGTISKSVYHDILKAKTGQIHYADVLLFRGDKLLILQRAGNMGSYSPEWCIPGGHVDPGETFKEAACRELFEETGIEIPEDLLFEVAQASGRDFNIHYFMAHVDDESPTTVLLDGEEEIGSAWITPKTELNDYDFIFDMKDNIKKILGIEVNENLAPMILKSFLEGTISESIFKAFCDSHKEDVKKSNNKTYFSHKERKDLAKEGEAMPNGKYPIRNKQDLHDAIKLVGASSMPESEVKAWIKKRAKALNLTSELPDDWKSKEDKEDVKKAMDVADTQVLAREDLDKKIVPPAGSGIAKSENGYTVTFSFNTEEEASLFKSMADELQKPRDGDEIEKAINFKKIQYESKEVLVDEKPDLYNYGTGTFTYSDNKGTHAENLFDFLGTLQKVSSLGKKFSVKIETEENGEQEWKFNEGIRLWNLVKSEDIKKSIEDNINKSEDGKKKGLFLKFINFLQGMSTRKDNLHWSELDNSKHVYLDEVGDKLDDFKDTLAEAGQSLFGRFDADTVRAEEVLENDPLKFIKLLFERTTDFREALEGDRNYFGELSFIDDFLVKMKQSIYRLQMH